MDSFARRLEQAVTQHGQLCVGIDPSESALADLGLPDTAQAARDFGYELIGACESRVGIVKPQVAFFERFGSAGLVALEEVMQAAHDAGLLVIADAKRGDIGTTMAGYAQAWFGDDSPLRSDALTVNPYLGPSSLSETIEIARDVQGGIFILAATSNPEASELQTAKVGARTVSERVLKFAQESGSGDVGVVIGATCNLNSFGLQGIVGQDCGVPVLAPGFGTQGAALEDLAQIFGASSGRVLANVSRAVTAGGVAKVGRTIDELKARL